MALSVDRVRTVTLDSYSTVVDVTAIETALTGHVEETASVARLWRSRSMDYARMSVPLDAYQSFYEVNRDALAYALEVHDVDLSTGAREEILSIYHDLPAFADVRGGVERIAEAGYDVYVVSNGDPDMLESMVETAGIAQYVVDTVSGGEIETYKPHVELYRHAAARTGTPIREIAHVTAGWVDTLGAMHAGMQSVWVNRDGRPWEAFGGDPDLTVGGFDDLVGALV